MEEVVLGALLYGDTETQIQAAMNLSELSTLQKHRLVDSGCITPLLAMLCSHHHHHQPIEASLFALLSLAFRSERNKIRIVESGAVPVLLQILGHDTESLIDLAVAALLILSSCASNKPSIAASGAIPVLLETLNTKHAISQRAKLDAIAAMQNLSTCNDVVPLLVSSGTVPSLLRIIFSSEKSSEMAEKAMALLEHAVSSSEIALHEAAGGCGAIRAMVEAVEEGTPCCKEHAAAILLAMCRSSRDKYRGLILREGAVPGLLQLSVDGAWRAREVAGDLLLLLRDYSDSKGGKRRGLKAKEMERIMEEIDAGGVKVGTTLRLVEDMIAKLTL